jgi:N-acetylglucosamine-6-phosphate deacetylase
MATLTPAEVLGIAQRKGRLCAGADADLLILGPDLAIRAVYRGGVPVGPEAP